MKLYIVAVNTLRMCVKVDDPVPQIST